MNGWNEYWMKQAQYQDQVRDANRQRLLKLMTEGCREPAFGQAIGNLVSSVGLRRLSGGRVPCDQPTRFLEKAV